MTSRSEALAEVAHNGGDPHLVDGLVDEVENDSAPVVDLLMQAPAIAEGEVRLDELGVRRLLRRLAYLKREADTLQALKRAVVAKYDEATSKRTDESDEIRQLLQTHLERVDGGKVKVPDVGTAYLSKRQPKLNVVDREAFVEWATGEYADKVLQQVFDDVGARALATARVVNDGEVPPPGTEFVPERREVSVRAAS